MDAHNAAVASIAARVQQFHERKQPFRIYHGSTNSTRESPYARDNIVDTSNLRNVLQINQKTKTVLVEPNVPMDQLVAATRTHGLVPLVVMEFPGITAGGGFSGTSGESSSFRHGFFDATVTRIEIVLPNGEVRSASPSTEPELFWGAASALGTLGVVTMLEVQCREARPYVELTYLPVSSMDQAMQAVRDTTADPTIEYLDGIVCARDHIVICAGRLADLPDSNQSYHVQQFTRPQDPWFYLHAQRRAKKSATPIVEYVPLEDYLFRYDRGAFWTGRYAFSYFITPFNRITRYILDYFMHTRVMYHALHASGLSHQFLIQDVAVPYDATDEFVTWLDEGDHFNAYPIWLCPLRLTQRHGGLMVGRTSSDTEVKQQPDDKGEEEGDKFLMNFGLWAPSPYRRKSPEFVKQNRQLENKVQALGGRKWLYAHAYYTEDEFWSIYNKEQYDTLRAQYHASYLPNVYEKVRVNLAPVGDGGWLSMLKEVWPIRGVYGVLRAFMGGEYLIRKKK